MYEIQDADAGEGLGDDVGERGGAGGEVHGGLAEADIVELGEGVDEHEDVGDLKMLRVPEYHPGWGGC